MNKLLFTISDEKPLEGFEQINDMICLKFFKIILATVLRIHCRGKSRGEERGFHNSGKR